MEMFGIGNIKVTDGMVSIQEQKHKDNWVECRSYGSYEYEPLGFRIEKIKLHWDCIILCYNNFDNLKLVYESLEHKASAQIRLMIIVTPFDEPCFKIVIEFINRNKDVYLTGCIPKNLESDEERERKFLSNVNKFDKIIYIGDILTLSSD